MLFQTEFSKAFQDPQEKDKTLNTYVTRLKGNMRKYTNMDSGGQETQMFLKVQFVTEKEKIEKRKN